MGGTTTSDVYYESFTFNSSKTINLDFKPKKVYIVCQSGYNANFGYALNQGYDFETEQYFGGTSSGAYAQYETFSRTDNSVTYSISIGNYNGQTMQIIVSG